MIEIILLFIYNPRNLINISPLINLFMNQTNKQKQRIYENNSVDSTHCCDPIPLRFRIVLHQSNLQPTKYNTKSKSREKGISLTRQSCSLQKLANPKLKLSIVRNSQNQHIVITESKNNLLCRDGSPKGVDNKRLKLAERCINYKNNRIEQRENFSRKQSYIYPQKSIKQQDDVSTSKNTPRIETCSLTNDLKLQVSNTIIKQALNPENSVIKINHIQPDHKGSLLPQIKSQISKHSFQKLMEQRQGKKIITIQSNQAPYSQINDYSITQSFVLGNQLN